MRGLRATQAHSVLRRMEQLRLQHSLILPQTLIGYLQPAGLEKFSVRVLTFCKSFGVWKFEVGTFVNFAGEVSARVLTSLPEF